MTIRRVARVGPGALAALLLLAAFSATLFAQSDNLIPPKPDRYITDQAGVLDSTTLDSINNQLDQFERDTSNQIVVAIYPNLPENMNIDQYTIDTYNAWQPGQKGKDNGALLLVAVKEHKMFICTGRGLEGALPDAVCKNIVTQEIAPRFKQGDYAGGISAGVSAMIAATKGEYQGNGTTVDDSRQQENQGLPIWAVILIIIVFFIIASRSRGSGGPFIYTGGGWGGGGGFGGGGGGGGFSGGGGGGGFSGGGGSSAGGGAGGGW